MWKSLVSTRKALVSTRKALVCTRKSFPRTLFFKFEDFFSHGMKVSTERQGRMEWCEV